MIVRPRTRQLMRPTIVMMAAALDGGVVGCWVVAEEAQPGAGWRHYGHDPYVPEVWRGKERTNTCCNMCTTSRRGPGRVRFLDQLQEAAETKASRTLCRELTVPQLTAPYTKTKRSVIVLGIRRRLSQTDGLS